MFYVFILFPSLLFIGVVTFGIIVYRKDCKKYEESLKNKNDNALINNPVDALYNYINLRKKASEYLFKDFELKSKSKTKIDLIYISYKGIYVIKACSSKGNVIGDSKDEYFLERINNVENPIRNPLLVNKDDITVIHNLTNQIANVHPLLVYTSGDISLINKNDDEILFIDELTNYFNEKIDVFSDTDLVEFYNELNNYLEVDED